MVSVLLRPWEPQVLDRWIDVAYILLWALYSAWGISVLIVGLPTIANVTPGWYFTAWAAGVGLSALVSCIFSFLVFFKTKITQITKKRIEIRGVAVLSSFILIYPVLATIAAISGDPLRFGAMFVAWSYLIFPILRIHILRIKIKALMAVGDA